MPDSAQPSGDQQPEQKSVLGFPVRPGGDGGAVAGGRHHWYELAQEVHGAFADIDRAVAAMQWSGDGRRAFDAAWSQLSGHGTEAAQHSQEMGDHLLTLGHQIDDAQHQWDMAMTAMAASTAIGIGLTFVTFGISDAVAEGAAAAAVATMEAVCAALDISLEAAVQVMIAAIRIGVQLAVKFTWQFGISVVSQETANAVQGQGLDHVNLLQAAEFAAAATVIPGLRSRATIGGKQVFSAADPAAPMPGSGALNAGATGGEGLGRLEGVQLRVSERGIARVQEHLVQFGSDTANEMMVERLRAALEAGQRITGADASFYMHELVEATMMRRGVPYAVAHAAALDRYGVSPFSVYAQEVVVEAGFNQNWIEFWTARGEP
jgi:hypothetical protein